MSWQVKDTTTELIRLRAEVTKIRDALFITGGASNLPASARSGGISGTGSPIGTGNANGLFAIDPAIGILTDVDSTGTSTGIFDKLNLINSTMIVDAVGALDLKFIQGTLADGQILYLKPKDGKQITLKTGGNIDIATDLFVNDNQCAIIVFFEDNQSPDANGNYVVATIASAAGGGGNLNTNLDNLANPTTPVKGIEMNNHEISELLFLSSVSGSLPTTGLLRAGNNQILLAQKTIFAGQYEVKVETNDFLDITQSGNRPVVLQMRAQNAVFPDSSFVINAQHDGAPGGSVTLSHGVAMNFAVGIETVFNIRSAGTGSGGLGKFVFDPGNVGLALDMNLKTFFRPVQILWSEFGVVNDGSSFTNLVQGVGYQFEDPIAKHLYTWRDTLLVDRVHMEIGVAGIVGGSNSSTPIFRWRIKAATNFQIGFQVTNESVTSGSNGTVGNVGTIQIPRLTGFPSPFTRAEFDNLFGNIIGAFGVIVTSGVPVLVVRRDDGAWYGVTLGAVV